MYTCTWTWWDEYLCIYSVRQVNIFTTHYIPTNIYAYALRRPFLTMSPTWCISSHCGIIHTPSNSLNQSGCLNTNCFSLIGLTTCVFYPAIKCNILSGSRCVILPSIHFILPFQPGRNCSANSKTVLPGFKKRHFQTNDNLYLHWPGPVNIIKFETGFDFDKKLECFTLNTQI